MNKKIFMFTGKGGVGKSSVASCHAIVSAQKNINTVLISIDPAHSLSDIFAHKISSDFTRVMDNLSLVEFDFAKILEEKFPNIKSTLADSFRKVDFSKISYSSSFDMPFIVNILALLKILDIYEKEEFENIIVDCPASASTFSYLKVPEMLAWYLEKFFGVGKGIIRTLSPISKYRYKINLPQNETLDKIELIYKRLIKLQSILKDRSISTVRLVSLAEKMVIEESKRDFSYLNLYDYNVDGIFVNRLYEDDKSSFTKKRLEIQEKYLREIENSFYSLPIYKLNLMKKDMKNIDDLKDFAKNFDDEILDIKPIEDNQIYEKKDGAYVLRINIGKIDEVNVYKKGTDINIRLKDIKRIVSLPSILADVDIEKTQRDDDDLLIIFKKEEGEDMKL